MVSTFPLVAAKDTEGDSREGRPQQRSKSRIKSSMETITATTAEPVSVLLHEEDDGDVDEPMHGVGNNDIGGATLHFPRQRTTTPSIAIAMSPQASRSKSRQRDTVDINAEMPDPTPRVAHLTGKARRKKKKAEKKAAAEPALRTVLGFTPTPIASGDEDSDFSQNAFRRKDLTAPDGSSINSSPYLRPSSSSGGISALRQQLDALDLEPVPGCPSAIRNKSKLGSETPSSASMASDTGSDRDLTEMTSYEIPLEHDFVSCDVGEEGDLKSLDIGMENVHRKMTAEDFEPLTCLGKGTYGSKSGLSII